MDLIYNTYDKDIQDRIAAELEDESTAISKLDMEDLNERFDEIAGKFEAITTPQTRQELSSQLAIFSSLLTEIVQKSLGITSDSDVPDIKVISGELKRLGAEKYNEMDKKAYMEYLMTEKKFDPEIAYACTITYPRESDENVMELKYNALAAIIHAIWEARKSRG